MRPWLRSTPLQSDRPMRGMSSQRFCMAAGSADTTNARTPVPALVELIFRLSEVANGRIVATDRTRVRSCGRTTARLKPPGRAGHLFPARRSVSRICGSDSVWRPAVRRCCPAHNPDEADECRCRAVVLVGRLDVLRAKLPGVDFVQAGLDEQGVRCA